MVGPLLPRQASHSLTDLRLPYHPRPGQDMGKCKERTCDPNVLVISLVWIEVDFVALQYEWVYQLFEELMMLYDVSEWLVVLCSRQNYNKSRIHSYRGARLVEMYLDAEIIFRGEIAK